MFSPFVTTLAICGFILAVFVNWAFNPFAALPKLHLYNFLELFHPDNYVIGAILLILFSPYLLFNFALYSSSKCVNKNDKKLILVSLNFGVIVSHIFILIVFVQSPSPGGGDGITDGISFLFLAVVFFIIAAILGGSCLAAIFFGIEIGFKQQKHKSKYIPYIAAFFVMLLISSLFVSVNNSVQTIQKKQIAVEKEYTVAVAKIRIQNNEDMFKHWTVRSDSVREYQFKLFHKKGFIAEYLKEVRPDGKPICLRRRIFDKNKMLIAEDTVKVSNVQVQSSGPLTSLRAVNFILSYSRKEITYPQLVKWCNYVILCEPMDRQDAWNIMQVVTRIGMSDKPQFNLSDEGLNELVGKLSVVARHPS